MTTVIPKARLFRPFHLLSVRLWTSAEIILALVVLIDVLIRGRPSKASPDPSRLAGR